jgi:dTDP-4-dehydrorhamnose reductase
MKILHLGSTGMLGTDCMAILEKEHEIIAPDKKTLDIISWDRVIESIQRIEPDVVINCAGITDFKACENNELSAWKINVEGPRNLAQGCARFGCKLVHFSSYRVYNGMKSVPQPYFEDDSSDPLSEYGKSKVQSETAIRENAPNYIILRTGWLYGREGVNFIKEIIKRALKGGRKKQTIRVQDDQFGSPTWTYRLAYQLRELLGEDALGTYHTTAEGYCSRFDYARFIVDKLDLKVNLESSKTFENGSKPKHPLNGILENRRLKKQGTHIMKEWDKDLGLFLDQYGADLIKEARKKRK